MRGTRLATVSSCFIVGEGHRRDAEGAERRGWVASFCAGGGKCGVLLRGVAVCAVGRRIHHGVTEGTEKREGVLRWEFELAKRVHFDAFWCIGTDVVRRGAGVFG